MRYTWRETVEKQINQSIVELKRTRGATCNHRQRPSNQQATNNKPATGLSTGLSATTTDKPPTPTGNHHVYNTNIKQTSPPNDNHNVCHVRRRRQGDENKTRQERGHTFCLLSRNFLEQIWTGCARKINFTWEKIEWGAGPVTLTQNLTPRTKKTTINILDEYGK